MPRAARATSRTLAVTLVSALALLTFVRPTYAASPAGDVPPPGAGIPADGQDGAPQYDPDEVATIAAGGYLQNKKRYLANPTAKAADVPASVDLRGYAPPVGDQGSIGMCVAWTISRNIMGYYANRTGKVDSPYAPLFLYMRNVTPGGAPNRGLNPDSVLANVQAYGVDSQNDYFQGTSNYRVAPTSSEIANAANYTITGWKRLWSGTNQGAPAQTAIQQALSNGTPVAVGFSVFQDFMDLGQHSLYDTTSGTSLGGHLVTAFGYDADGVYLRNQWGTSWGNNGDAHVSWSFIRTVVSGAYTIDGISTPASPVALTPQVTALSTTSGSAGDTVTVTGGGLASATRVTVGGVAASFTRSVANGVTRLVVTIPRGVGGQVDIAVAASGGTSDTGGSADDYTVSQPAPAITGLSPSTTSRSGGSTITLTGSGFTGVTQVKVGTTYVDAASVTDDTVTFVAPDRSGTGNVPVTVTSSGGTSNYRYLTYVASGVPTITKLTPATGVSTKTVIVVVTGTNLVNIRKVTLGSTTLSYTSKNASTLNIFVKARTAGTANLVITTAGGVSNPYSYSAVAPKKPAIGALNPAGGLTTVATLVTVTGGGFTGATRVSLGGRSVSFTRVNDSVLRFTAPKRAAGRVILTVVAPGGTATYRYFTYATNIAPKLSSLSRTSGNYKAMTTTTVSGVHLSKVTKVTASGKRTSFRRITNTSMSITLVRHAKGTVRVQATSAGGRSNLLSFTYR
jgi:hypothetical protein